MTSHYTRGSMTTLHDFGGVLGRPLRHFSFGLSQFCGHGSWLVCSVAFFYSRGRRRHYKMFLKTFLMFYFKKTIEDINP